MIAPNVVSEVRRLLDEGTCSQRKIARLTGVSRGSIAAIASGRRPDYQSMSRSSNDQWEEPTGPPERCTGCGGMVFKPCQLCLAREVRLKSSSRPRWRAVVQNEALAALDLRPEHRARYEEVLAWRREQACAGITPVA